MGVLHLWDLPDSDRDLEGRLAAQLARQLADQHGIELGVESIPCTVATPLGNLRHLLDRHPMAADDLWPAVRHLRVKHFDGSFMDLGGNRRWLGPGEGGIDFSVVSNAWLPRRGHSVPRRSLQRTLAAAHLSLHVRT